MKKKQLEKLSINLKPEKNSLLRELIKREKNSIEAIVSIHNRTLDFEFLLGGYILQREKMWDKVVDMFSF